LTKEINGIKAEKESLGLQIESLRSEIDKLCLESKEKDERHAAELDNVKEELNKCIHDNLIKYEEETRALEKACNERLEASGAQIRALREQCNAEIETAKEERNKTEIKLESLSAEHKKLSEEKKICEARLKGVREQFGLMTDADDFTERETFCELETEFAAFKRFYNRQWKQTKKKIRKSILNVENLTEQKRQK
jgi:hypothetical protein